jgi:hypothetical protein
MDQLNDARQGALMTDHPGWHSLDGTSAWTRVLRSTAGVTWIRASSDGRVVLDTSDQCGLKQLVVWSDPADLPPDLPMSLLETLSSLGASCRLRNAWLWDAITTAVLRQVVRADQARRLYRRWCTSHGERVVTPAGTMSLVPDPVTVLGLSDESFAATGARFHRAALRACATACVKYSTEWEQLPAAELVTALQTIPRVGPWTAAAAAADYTGDFSVYPYSDLAVRTWAQRAAPTVGWPATAAGFAAAWGALAHTSRQLHTLTLLTLAWGNHASDRHRDPSAPP